MHRPLWQKSIFCFSLGIFQGLDVASVVASNSEASVALQACCARTLSWGLSLHPALAGREIYLLCPFLRFAYDLIEKKRATCQGVLDRIPPAGCRNSLRSASCLSCLRSRRAFSTCGWRQCAPWTIQAEDLSHRSLFSIGRKVMPWQSRSGSWRQHSINV